MKADYRVKFMLALICWSVVCVGLYLFLTGIEFFALPYYLGAAGAFIIAFVVLNRGFGQNPVDEAPDEKERKRAIAARAMLLLAMPLMIVVCVDIFLLGIGIDISDYFKFRL